MRLLSIREKRRSEQSAECGIGIDPLPVSVVCVPDADIGDAVFFLHRLDHVFEPARKFNRIGFVRVEPALRVIEPAVVHKHPSERKLRIGKTFRRLHEEVFIQQFPHVRCVP